MHNTGFQYHNLPHKYHLFDSQDIEKVGECFKDPKTGGGSVTMPHKQAVLRFVNTLSDSATKIGAINTIHKKDGILYGDNTDWLAIYKLLKKKLGEPFNKDLIGLIVGAGGTAHAACYAVSQLGIQFYVYNRTVDKAEHLAKQFGGKPIVDLSKLQTADIVIGTVPPQADFKLPQHLVKKSLVVVELVYHPRKTPLIQQAQKEGCTVVEGVEILVEQGIEQFRIWTMKDAPLAQIICALMAQNPDLANDIPSTFRNS